VPRVSAQEDFILPTTQRIRHLILLATTAVTEIDSLTAFADTSPVEKQHNKELCSE
jgi:hypothetical protein